MTKSGPAVFAAVLALAAPAAAFDEQLHRLLAREAVPEWPPPAAAGDAATVVQDFGLAVACRVGQSPWSAREPRPTAMRALGWNESVRRLPWQPGAAVHDAFGAWVEGSASPDDDGRNRDRVLRGPDGAPLAGDAAGTPIAIDPLIRQFGAATGLPGQAHAHYALPPGTQPGVLAWLRDPARGAWDLTGLGEVASEADAQADLHVALARRVAAVDVTAAAYLLGGALHYLHDAADPLHNVHSGARRLLWNAAWGAWQGDQPLTAAGVRVLRNLHLGAEALQAAWFMGRGPESGRLQFSAVVARRSDVDFEPGGRPALWVDALAGAGVIDGLRVYALMNQVMPSDLRLGLVDLPDSLDAAADWSRVLDDQPDPAALEELGVLLGTSIARARAATRALAAWGPAPPAALEIDRAAARLQAQVERVARRPYPVAEIDAGLDPALCESP